MILSDCCENPKGKFIALVVFGGLACALACSNGDSSRESDNSNQIIIAFDKGVHERKLSPDTSLFERNLPVEIVLPSDDNLTARRILKDYGAVFVARGNIVAPPVILFENEADCFAWQSKVETWRESFGGIEVELQTAAMDSLLAARDKLRGKKLNLSVRGTWGGSRTYKDTEKIWATRITPGLIYWTARGKLSGQEAERIRALAPAAQIAEILRLEANGMFFSKDFSKSVLYSATPPGASQHLSMLAVDIVENGNAEVRRILAEHGWFQTVLSDAPHFTYLGTTENQLPSLGLKKLTQENRVFWIPDFAGEGKEMR